ncbi:MAG: hypothetical protein WCE21_01470 [Candidatus Babeliales bacterium]
MKIKSVIFVFIFAWTARTQCLLTEKLAAARNEITTIKESVKLDTLEAKHCKRYQCAISDHKKRKTKLTKEQVITKVMNYPMTDVIKRCQKDFGYTAADMKILEQELKRYFILTILFPRCNVNMYSEDVDKLWHSFILFTKDYSLFCKTCSGSFLHHAPETDTVVTPAQSTQNYEDLQRFVKTYEEIFKENTHPIWFLDMC